MIEIFASMSDFCNVTMILVFIATFLLVYIATKRPSGIPPGPPCWPIIGNLGSMIGKDTLKIFDSFRQRYGDVYSLYFGTELNVILNGYDVIYDAFVKRGRVFSSRIEDNGTGKSAVVFAVGPRWKANRTFIMQALSEVCFKSDTLETFILEELKYLKEKLNSINGPIYPARYFSPSLANIIALICFGKRPGYDDERFNWYLAHVEEAFTEFMLAQLKIKCFPFIKYLPGTYGGRKDVEERKKTLKTFFKEMSERSFVNFKDTGTKSVTDMLYSRGCPIEKEDIFLAQHELMSAGSETTATTITWFVLLMAMFPEEQEKLYGQVYNILGDLTPPSMRYRQQLPYVEAVCIESLRIGCVVPFALPHSVTDDVMFKGYFIPKGSSVLPNIASVNFDPTIFPDPYTFKPGRFLSDDETIVNTEKVLAFSLGPRSCLGETIARTELFMYVAALSQQYKFVKVKELPTLRGVMGITHRTQNYEVKFVQRKTSDIDSKTRQ